MGWSIHYEFKRYGRGLSVDEETALSEKLSEVNSRLHVGCEDVHLVRLSESKLSGFTKVHYSVKDVADYLSIFDHLRAVKLEFPDIRIEVSDDYFVERAEINNVKDIRNILKENGQRTFDSYNIFNILSLLKNPSVFIQELKQGKRFFN